MDLLTPWKMCLQCLPVFSSDPPSKALPLHSTSAETKRGAAASAFSMNSSENDFQECEKPSFSDASLTHDDHQHQDLPLSDYAKEVGSLAYTPVDTNPVVTDDAKHADHETNQMVFTDTVQAPHGVEFTTSLPSPITPPIGLGYIVGQHTPSHHIHHQVNSQHNKGHSFFHSHGHHDKAPPLHPISDSIPNDQRHPHPPLSSSQSGGKEEAHHHTHQHSHKQNDDTIDDGFHAPPHPPPMTSHVHGTLPLETSHSTPADIELVSGPHGLYEDEDTAMNGSSSALVTSQTEPIDGVGPERVRRRDQFKHQFKDLRNQLKQGGHHLKEEGSKHLQNMMSTVNKQSQQIEESRSFFTVPRNHTS